MTMGGGIDVGFSDDRFLQRVLQEAQRGNVVDDGAVKRIERMGFSSEVTRIALHVAAGNEQRALELCMSGLAFTGSGAFATAKAGGSTTDGVGKLSGVSCYICGQRHVHEKSLEFHLKACKKRFQQRELKRAPNQRRPLLEAHELPPGAGCVEDFYDNVYGARGASDPRKPNEGSRDPLEPGSFEEWISKNPRKCPQSADILVPCDHCGRTFSQDRIAIHRKACGSRPKDVAPPPPPRRRSSSNSVVTGSAARSGGESPAGVKAYEDFVKGLAKCPGCSRQLRADLLQSHVEKCSAAKTLQASHLAAKALQAKALHARRAPLARSPGPPQHRHSDPGSGIARGSPSSAKATSTSRRHSAGVVSDAGVETKAPSFGFAPPSRYVPATSPVGSGSPKGSSSGSVGGSLAAADDSLQSCEALAAKGYIIPASEEEVLTLRMQLEGSIEGSDFVSAWKASLTTQQGVYEALKMNLEEQRGLDGKLEELELWHGTLWSTVPKILRQGFNRSFAGKHGTLLGIATYFSADLAYSNRFCDRRGGGKDGTKVVFLARVLVGSYCKGSPTDVEPPIMDLDTGERYDSTVDNDERPSIFAVFRDFQALPLYIIEFRS